MSRIFLSYRRDDTAGYAGRLYDRLLAKFGAGSVFRDIDSIEPGVDFVVAIDQAVRRCDAFIAVMGNTWLTAADPSGNRRLDNPDDYVRNEIAAALRANLLFIPVLVERAQFPARSDLPAPLQRLTRYNAIELSDDRWNYDIERLLTRLETALSGRDQSALHVPDLEAASVLRGGSNWTLYRARRSGTSRSVTAKVLTVSDLSGEAKERFERDCRVIAELSWHPSLATVHQWGTTDDGHPFAVMEDLDGSSLEDRLRRGGPQPWPEVVAIGIRLADALDGAHRAGALHCDVSPSKVLLGPMGEPLLADFGMARLENKVGAVTSGVVNSIAHAAPEVLTSGSYSVASDVYSLGSTLHALLAGRPPFMGHDEAGFVAMVARASTQPVPDLRPLGVPDSVCSVLERAMAKMPESRWASAADLRDALVLAQHREMGIGAATAEQPGPPPASLPEPPPPAPEAVPPPPAPEAPEPPPPAPEAVEEEAPPEAPEADAEPVPALTARADQAAPSAGLEIATSEETHHRVHHDRPDGADREDALPVAATASPPWWRRRRVVSGLAAAIVICLAGVAGVAVSSSIDDRASQPDASVPAPDEAPTTVPPPDPPTYNDSLVPPSVYNTHTVPEGSSAITDEGLRVRLGRRNTFLDFPAPVNLGPRTSVEVDATPPKAERVLTGLFCKPSVEQYPRYSAYARSDGYWIIRRYGPDRGVTTLAEADGRSQYSSAILPSGPNRVRLDCLSDGASTTLALYVNGQPVATVRGPDPLPRTHFGVSVSDATNPPVDVIFRNLTAKEL